MPSATPALLVPTRTRASRAARASQAFISMAAEPPTTLAIAVRLAIAAAVVLPAAPRALPIPSRPLEVFAMLALLVTFLVLVLLSARPSALLVPTWSTDRASSALLEPTRRLVPRPAHPAHLVLSPARKALPLARPALLVLHVVRVLLLALPSTAQLESTLATVPARLAPVEPTVVLTRRLALLARPTLSPLAVLRLALLAHLALPASPDLLNARALARLVNI